MSVRRKTPTSAKTGPAVGIAAPVAANAAPKQSEKQFGQAVVDYARIRGWLVYRTWNSKHSPAGFPDLCLVRRERLIFAELKVGRNRLTKPQCAWIDWLSLVSWEAKKCGFDK